jgi:tRNA(adenine34) deaminase
MIVNNVTRHIHEGFMRLALDEARCASSAGEVPVGAVLVLGDVVLAKAANRCIGDHDPSAHAEINALRAAGVATSNYRLAGSTLYVTLEPCVMCAGAIVNARVATVVFGCPDPDAGAAGSVANLLDTPFLNHRCDVVSGVLEDPCRALLKEFFQQRRVSRSVQS